MGKKRKSGDAEPDMVIEPVPGALRSAMSAESANRRALTPDNILRSALEAAFGRDRWSRTRHRAFVAGLMRSLSMLVTAGKDPEVFEPDFDTFMTMVVRSINECGEMLCLLHENGIDYKPKWRRGEDGEYGEDGEDGEDGGIYD